MQAVWSFFIKIDIVFDLEIEYLWKHIEIKAELNWLWHLLLCKSPKIYSFHHNVLNIIIENSFTSSWNFQQKKSES